MLNWNGESLEDIEKEAIKQAAAKMGRPIGELAKALGISRASLYRKLFLYAIRIEGERINKRGV